MPIPCGTEGDISVPWELCELWGVVWLIREAVCGSSWLTTNTVSLQVSAMSREAFNRLLGDLGDIMHRQIADYATAAEVVESKAQEGNEGGSS